MTKLILIFLLVSQFSFGQAKPPPAPPTQKPAPKDINLPAPDPAKPPPPPEWGWVRGEDAEELLLKMNWELQNGVRGIKILNEILGLSRWLSIFVSDDPSEPPKAFRIQVKHMGHSQSAPPEAYFTYELIYGRLRIPLFSFGGELYGISQSVKNPSELYVYFHLKEIFVEPATQTEGYVHTATVTCDVCDDARAIVAERTYPLMRYKNDKKNMVGVHFTGKKDDRIEVITKPR
jgi:hypothetical protein